MFFLLHLLPLDIIAGVGFFVGGAGEAGDQAAADGAFEEAPGVIICGGSGFATRV